MNVLLVDADPQGSLSQGFFGSSSIEELPANQTLALLFDDTSFQADYSALVVPTEFERISVCPANHHLAIFNTPAPETTGMFQYVVREFIQEQTGFDLVLIDCPPNLYRCTWTAMIASDFAIVPVPPEDFGTQGLRAVHQAIDQARQLNPDLRRLGHLVTRYDRRLLIHRSYHERLRKIYDKMVLDTVVRRSIRLNFELQDAGTLSIERTIVIADELWPSNEHLPTESLQRWIDEQHNHGIWLRLLRLSSILNEPDLHADFGIYGTRAVGVQELGFHSKTARFILYFDFDRVREAEARWDRLAVYATSYRDLLDPREFEV